jgi:hypothetical protein
MVGFVSPSKTSSSRFNSTSLAVKRMLANVAAEPHLPIRWRMRGKGSEWRSKSLKVSYPQTHCPLAEYVNLKMK